MAKKPRQPKLDSILNSPENINMNDAVRAQIEAAQAQIDKETKEAKQAAKEAKQAAKEIAQQLKKAKKESKQTEKKVPEEEKDSFKDKILKLDIEEFNKVFPLLEKIMASKNNKIGNNIASTDLDYNSNTASTDLGINTNTASTDSSYYILTDIVSSQQTSINILKEILTVLKGSSGNSDGGGGLDIDINGSGRRSGGGGSRSNATRGGRGKYSGLLKTFILGLTAVAGYIGYNYLNSSSNDDEKLNAEPSSTPPPVPATPPAITPIPESQIFDRGEPAPEPLTQQTQDIRVNAGSNIPREMTLNPVATPSGIRLNAGIDTTSAIRLNQSIVPSIPSISLNSTNRVNQTRADLAGITAAQLMGRNQQPAQRINSNTERIFNNLPRPEYGLISPNVNNYNHEPVPPPAQRVSPTIQIIRPIENYVRKLNELDRIEESNNNSEGITNPNSSLLTERSSLENGFIQSLSRLNNIPIAERPSPPEGTFERLNLIRQRQGAPELPPIPGPRGGAFAGEQDNTNASLVSSSSVGDYNPEPMPFQRTIASIPQEQRSRILLAGTTAAQLMGRDAPQAGRINSDVERAFNAIPQAINSPEGSRTQRTLGFTPEQYGPPVPIAQPATAVTSAAPASPIPAMAISKTPPAASATSTAIPKTPPATSAQPEDAIAAALAAARARRLRETELITGQASAFAAGVNRMAAPLTRALSGVQEKRGDTVEEEDGVKQYKADEIVFKADKFDFGNNQDSSTSSPAPAASRAPSSTSGSGPGPGSSSSTASATGTSTSAATPMQPTIVTGPRMARDSAANAAAERIMPSTLQPPAATGQNTRAPGGQQRSDVIPQIDPNNPGPLEPANAGSRYARLFGMGVAA